MEITAIYDKFSERMAQIELFQRAVHEVTKRELKILSDHADWLKETLPEFNGFFSAESLTFRDVRTGKPQIYRQKESDVEEKQRAVIIHKNKQYQWLLAEAYEIFEDLLEFVYAYCGQNDPNFWPLSDYGNISLSEINGREFDWYLERAKNKKGKPKSILDHLRKRCPDYFAAVEQTNALEIDFRFMIILIEKLRHAIVHTSGIVFDKDAFIEDVLKAVGIPMTAKNADEYIDYAKWFFGGNEYQNTILLLEKRVDPDVPFDITISRFGALFSPLISYGKLLCEVGEQVAGEYRKNYEQPDPLD